MKDHPLSNQQLFEELGKHVYGHSAAKKAIINVINRQRLRWQQQFSFNIPEDDLIENHNLLLVGASGTGKTHLVKTMAKLCDFPLLCFDATHIVPVGGKGDVDVLKIAKEIKNQANYWAKKSNGLYTFEEVMAQTVIFIDEVDKLGIELHSGSNWNKEAQASLLKLVAGDDDEIRGVTFIFAGAFTSVFEARKSKKSDGIGFTFSKNEEEEDLDDWDDRIVKAGIIHELAGRINQVVCLENLTIDHYYEILHSLILPKLIKELAVFYPGCASDGWVTMQFELSNKSIDDIVKKSFESGQGVRMLKKKLFALYRDLEFNYDTNTHKPSTDKLTKEIHNFIEDQTDYLI